MATLRNIPPVNINRRGEQQNHGIMEREDFSAHKISEYELFREERIKENRERMQKLGIVDISLKLKSLKPTPKRAYQRRTPQVHSPLPPSGPIRRSSRLQNSTPVSYCEVHVPKKEKSLKDDDFRREEGSRPEVYTEEHEKLLGSIEKSWTLFVDGYGKDGKRIYDQVKGKTCHQCRQKTLGHRTHCSKCNLVQGQFCGDCLYMRYGENVLEANQNPDWICPVCRGICNCSLCRQAKGWPPTGILYRKISNLGYKSVAHYLIQTRRSNTDSDKNAVTQTPVSAKRSLPFSDIEVSKGDDDLSKLGGEYLNIYPISQSAKEIDDSKITLEGGADTIVNPDVASPSKDQVEYQLKSEPENNATGCNEKKEVKFLVDLELEDNNTKPGNVTETKTTIEPPNDYLLAEPSECLKKSSMLESLGRDDDNEIKADIVGSEKTPESIKKSLLVNGKYASKNGEKSDTIADADTIGGRLKMRRRA